MILLIHNRYRTTGGEERVVEDLQWLVREHLGRSVAVLERDSARLGRARAAAGLLRGGLDPREVADAVERTGARIVHAHNLVCAVGTCVDPAGHDCTRCHGRRTAAGVRLNCRGSRAEAAVYGAGLALWQRRTVELADAIVVPSEAALRRLRELGAPVDRRPVHVVGHVVRAFAERSTAAEGRYALVVSRLAPEKGVEVAIDACRAIGMPLVVCGAGPLEEELRRRAAGADVTFAGRVDDAELARLRAGAAVALAPSRAAETFGLAALEAMAAGVPVVAARVGALADLEGAVELVPPGDPEATAAAVRRVVADREAGTRALEAARRRAAPEVVAPRLEAVYAAVLNDERR